MSSTPVDKQNQFSESELIQKLEAVQAKLKKIESLSCTGHWEVDILSGENTWSEQLFKILGLHSDNTVPTTELLFSLSHPEDFERVSATYLKSIEIGSPYKIENRIIRPNGEIRYVISEGIIETGKDGKPVKLFGVFKDITDQKNGDLEHLKSAKGEYSQSINPKENTNTQQISEESQIMELVRNLELAQEIGKIGYWELDLGNKEIFWSDEVFKIWGVEKDTFKPSLDKFESTIHPDDLNEFLNHQSGAIAGLHPLDKIHRILLANGEIKYVHEKGILESDSISGNKRFKGTVQDITLQKNFELELVKRNQFIESTLQNLSLGIAVNQISTQKVTYINPAFSRIYGWSEEYLTNLPSFFEKIYPDPEYRSQITKRIFDDIESGIPDRMEWKEIPITTQLGETRIITAKNISLPDQDLMISTVIDDTSRYWAQQSLQKSNERFHLATEAVSDAVSDWDISTGSIFWGKGFHRLFGYPVDMEFVSPNIWESKVHPDDLEEIKGSIFKARKDPTVGKWSGEYRFQKYNGTYAYVKENTVIIRDLNGVPIRIVGAIQDVTERKESEKKIQEYNERFNIIANATNDAIWDWRIDTGEHFWSEGFNRFLEEDVAGIHFDFSKWSDRIHPEDKQKITENLYKILGDPSINYFQSEYRFIKKSGDPIYVIDKGRIIRDEEGKAIRMVGAIQDITERKTHEESLKKLNTSLEQINHELEISNKTFREIAWIQSHVVRAPLARLMGLMNLFENIPENDSEKLELIKFINESALELDGIIREICLKTENLKEK